MGIPFPMLAAAAEAGRKKSCIVLQAVVTFGERTSEGHVIEAVAPAWIEILKLIQEDSDVLYELDPRKWEEILAGAYEREGYDEVILTPRSGDFGRDVIAIKRGFGSVRLLDQMKAYSPEHLVKANDVRAMIGVLTGDQNASKGIVTTTSDFAPRIVEDPLIKPFIPYRLELVNGRALIERLSRLVGPGS